MINIFTGRLGPNVAAFSTGSVLSNPEKCTTHFFRSLHAHLLHGMNNLRVDNIATFKVVLLGDQSVGKTALLHRLLYRDFKTLEMPTVSASFFSASFDVGPGAVGLDLWDTAGQEKYRSLVPHYLKNARAALLCFDTTSRDSFESLDSWLKILRESEESCRIFLVRTKADLDEDLVIVKEAQDWAADHHCKLFTTSAKTGDGVDRLFQTVASDLMEAGPLKHDEEADSVDINAPADRKTCC